MNSKRNRLAWADSLKGLLIVLVVLGHAIQNTLGSGCEFNHVWNMIYSFHMPAFMAISGFLAFRESEVPKDRMLTSCFSIIVRRFRQLVIPFIIWTIVLVVVKSGFSFKVLGDYLVYPDKGLWFLWVLFLINVLFVLGTWLAKKMSVKQEMVILGICLLLTGIMVLCNVRVFGFQFIAYYFLFYTLGFYLHKYYDKVVTKNPIILLFLVALWSILAWFWKMHELPFFLQSIPISATLAQYVYRFITAAIAVYALLAASPTHLDKKNWINVPFIKLGAVSLGIYTIHFIVMGIIVGICRCITPRASLVILSSFVLSLLFSWLSVWIISKWKISSRILLGKL